MRHHIINRAGFLLALILLLISLLFNYVNATTPLQRYFTDDDVQELTVEPFKLPRFNGGDTDLNKHIPALKEAPPINGDMIFKAITNCYPARSKFQLELSVEAALRDQVVSSIDTTQIGRHYVGIVARMPIYSATELDREREREYMRRSKTAELIGQMVGSIAKRNHASRQLGLYSSLETRSQLRVVQGIVDTSEQVAYLEKLAAAQADYVTQNTLVMQARIALAGQCGDNNYAHVNDYLIDITKEQ